MGWHCHQVLCGLCLWVGITWEPSLQPHITPDGETLELPNPAQELLHSMRTCPTEGEGGGLVQPVLLGLCQIFSDMLFGESNHRASKKQ